MPHDRPPRPPLPAPPLARALARPLARPVAADCWTCLIPDYFPPSPNRTLRRHWSAVRRHKKRAMDLVAAYGHPLPAFEGPVKLSITRFWGRRQRAWDPDNLAGSVKPLVDALRAPSVSGRHRSGGLGVIHDDAPGQLDLYVHQTKNDDGSGRECCLIHITPDDDADPTGAVSTTTGDANERTP